MYLYKFDMSTPMRCGGGGGGGAGGACDIG